MPTLATAGPANALAKRWQHWGGRVGGMLRAWSCIYVQLKYIQYNEFKHPSYHNQLYLKFTDSISVHIQLIISLKGNRMDGSSVYHAPCRPAILGTVVLSTNDYQTATAVSGMCMSYSYYIYKTKCVSVLAYSVCCIRMYHDFTAA